MSFTASFNGTLRTTSIPIEPAASTLSHEKVRLGDTCYVILPDISPLAARVIRIMRRRKDPGSTEIELGNFRPVQGERISDIERRVKHADGRSGVWDRSRVINPDGTLPASALDGVIDAVQNQIRAGGGEVVMDDEGFRVLDTGDPETALGKLHAVARDGEAALVLGKRDSPIDPWEERVRMTSSGFRLHAEEVVAGTFTGDRLHIGPETTYEAVEEFTLERYQDMTLQEIIDTYGSE